MVPGVRSDGDVNSLDGATGGAAAGAGALSGGLAWSSIAGGADGITGGADRAGGVGWASAGSDIDAASMAPRMISQGLTAGSPVLLVGPPS